jgi:hypothetical protein
MISTDYFFLLLFAPARAKMFVAVLAPILLPTLSIMSVFHDVTAAASVRDYFLYHHTILTHHLLFCLYLIFKSYHEKFNFFVRTFSLQDAYFFCTKKTYPLKSKEKNMHYSEILRTAREQANLSLREVAIRADLSEVH